MHCSLTYYPGQNKSVTAEKFMRLIRQSGHVKSCHIELRFDVDAAHGSVHRELALQIEVDVAWYHTIVLPINPTMMNISAVTIFLARVVVM